jgi:hypothetical protein
MSELLTLKFEHEEPLELMAVSRSLSRLSQRYVRLSKSDKAEEAQLYIKKVVSGSLHVDLTPLVAVANSGMLVPDAVNSAVTFVRNMKSLVDYFLGRGQRPDEITTRDCDEIKEIVQPIAVQSKGMFNVQASDSAKVAITINLNQVEANAVQNRAVREREILKEPHSEDFKDALFYWQTADRDKAAAAGQQTPDRGVIEKIDSRPRRIFVPDPAVKSKLVAGAIFETGYLVDGQVIVAKDKVQGYRITAVQDSFPLEG